MTRYYKIELVEYDEDLVGLATAAQITCHLCGSTIAGMGGPGEDGSICETCANHLTHGRLRGCVKYD